MTMDRAMTLGRLIECLQGCLGNDGVTRDTPVGVLPEFGTAEPIALTGLCVRYLAGTEEARATPPIVAVEYGPGGSR